jgi:hypothetical protein
MSSQPQHNRLSLPLPAPHKQCPCNKLICNIYISTKSREISIAR